MLKVLVLVMPNSFSVNVQTIKPSKLVTFK